VAFTVEPGTGSSTANSYVTVAEVNDYWTDRGGAPAAWTALGTTAKQGLIVKACDYVDVRFRWRGTRALSTQAMEWPRLNAQRDDGTLVVGIPTELKEAVAEYAIRAASADLAPDPSYQDENAPLSSKREKVGPIESEVRYAGGGTVLTFRKYPTADQKLRELIIGGHSGQLMRA
jgi:hypothetical protein